MKPVCFSLLARFKDCPVIAVAAKPGGPEAPDTEEPQGVPELIEVASRNKLLGSLMSSIYIQKATELVNYGQVSADIP